jgi:hypothetical protein
VAQVFPASANTLAILSLVVIVLLAMASGAIGVSLYRSPFVTQVNVAKTQPIPFSHFRHVAGNGLDCRFCHVSVEESSFAGIPPTETCMSCHSQILVDSDMLEPVHHSWRMGDPLEWIRVNDVPDFVYFNHSIHIAKGVGCATCHGPVDQMPLTWKTETLHMQWCLECHRAPEKFIRPQDKIFDMQWSLPPSQQLEQGRTLVEEYNIQVGQLEDCSICHR